MNKHRALNSWLSEFAPAYAAGSVPDDAELPYMTYQAAWAGFGERVSVPVTLWCGTSSEAKANEMAGLLGIALGMGGDIVKCDEGAIWIMRGTPFIQSSVSIGPNMKARYINLEIEMLTI